MVNGGYVGMSFCSRRTRQTVIWVAAAMAVLSVLLWCALIRHALLMVFCFCGCHCALAVLARRLRLLCGYLR